MDKSKYSAKARSMTPAQLRNSIHDVENMLEYSGPRETPYVQGLRAELVAYQTETKMRASGQVKVSMKQYAYL